MGVSTVEVGSLEIAYREAGTGDPVVMVHGWPTDSRLWTDQMSRLQGRHRVLAPDLPGYGGSQIPPVNGFELSTSTLVGFLDALGVERAALVGHDAGGPPVLLTAIRHPRRVSRLVVMDTTPYPQLALLVRLMVTAAKLPGIGEGMMSRPGFRMLFRVGTAGGDAEPVGLADRFRPPDRERRRALLAALRQFDRRELEEVEAGLGSITAPTLVVWAAKDPAGPLSLAHRLSADISGSTMVTVPNCGHFLPLDRPAEIGELLAAFLD